MRHTPPIALPTPLAPLLAYEITIRIGLVPDSDHAQLHWKVEDPTAEQLLGMGSCPHASLANIPRVSRVHLEQLLDAVFFHLEPF